MTAQPTLLIGLTGGIASGKTAVSDQLAALGAYVVDTDELSREAVALGSSGLNHVVEAFGKGICLPSGELNRSALRERIFANPADRDRLNAILHPAIEELAHGKLLLAPAEAAYRIIVIPLLVETNAVDRYPINRVLLVDVSQETQINRLMLRDSITRTQAEDILQAQADREQRLMIADDVINNDGSLAQLSEQVSVIHEKYCQIASYIEP